MKNFRIFFVSWLLPIVSIVCVAGIPDSPGSKSNRSKYILISEDKSSNFSNNLSSPTSPCPSQGCIGNLKVLDKPRIKRNNYANNNNLPQQWDQQTNNRFQQQFPQDNFGSESQSIQNSDNFLPSVQPYLQQQQQQQQQQQGFGIQNDQPMQFPQQFGNNFQQPFGPSVNPPFDQSNFQQQQSFGQSNSPNLAQSFGPSANPPLDQSNFQQQQPFGPSNSPNLAQSFGPSANPPLDQSNFQQQQPFGPSNSQNLAQSFGPSVNPPLDQSNFQQQQPFGPSNIPPQVQSDNFQNFGGQNNFQQGQFGASSNSVLVQQQNNPTIPQQDQQQSFGASNDQFGSNNQPFSQQNPVPNIPNQFPNSQQQFPQVNPVGLSGSDSSNFDQTFNNNQNVPNQPQESFPQENLINPNPNGLNLPHQSNQQFHPGPIYNPQNSHPHNNGKYGDSTLGQSQQNHPQLPLIAHPRRPHPNRQPLPFPNQNHQDHFASPSLLEPHSFNDSYSPRANNFGQNDINQGDNYGEPYEEIETGVVNYDDEYHEGDYYYPPSHYHKKNKRPLLEYNIDVNENQIGSLVINAVWKVITSYIFVFVVNALVTYFGKTTGLSDSYLETHISLGDDGRHPFEHYGSSYGSKGISGGSKKGTYSSSSALYHPSQALYQQPTYQYHKGGKDHTLLGYDQHHALKFTKKYAKKYSKKSGKYGLKPKPIGPYLPAYQYGLPPGPLALGWTQGSGGANGFYKRTGTANSEIGSNRNRFKSSSTYSGRYGTHKTSTTIGDNISTTASYNDTVVDSFNSTVDANSKETESFTTITSILEEDESGETTTISTSYSENEIVDETNTNTTTSI